MKWSDMWIATLKEVPKEAVVRSHILMLRAGFIFKQSSGIYGYLPLGQRVLEKVTRIVKEEIEGTGASMLSFPNIVPKSFWEESGRFEKMGKSIFSFQDRHDKSFILGPTHEESIVEMLKGRVSSYKQLPINLFQIEKKFRDEVRPRYGVMRGREFMMMDGYSFHLSLDNLEETYKAYRIAYRRIFTRMGLYTLPVSADSGDMGGEGSEEFMVPNEIGDDTIFSCTECSYVANKELAAFTPSFTNFVPLEKKEVSTPNVTSITMLAEFFKVSPEQTVKTVVFRTKKEKQWILAMTSGDREVNETKLSHIVGDEVIYEEDAGKIEECIGPVGFLGPHNLSVSKDVILVVDKTLYDDKSRVVGMNKKDMHYQGFNFSSFNSTFTGDISSALEGDICPICKNGTLKSFAGIEVGHIFKLGDDYTKMLGFSVLSEQGKPSYPLMGCYGIGLDRSIAAVIEQEGRENELVLPSSISPFHVLVLSIGKENSEKAKELSDKLEENYEVLWDDRDVSAGIKLNDSELLGIPIRVTLGKKYREEGLCGIKHYRISPIEEFVLLEEVPKVVEGLLKKEEDERQERLKNLHESL